MSSENPKEEKVDKRATAQAFTDRLNVTPAACSEADRFRNADDALRALSSASVQALQSCAGREIPADVATVMECWCLLLDVQPASVDRCAELAADLSEFKLVGLGTLNYLGAEGLSTLETRTRGLDASSVSTSSCPGAEAASAMLEWLQAYLLSALPMLLEPTMSHVAISPWRSIATHGFELLEHAVSE